MRNFDDYFAVSLKILLNKEWSCVTSLRHQMTLKPIIENDLFKHYNIQQHQYWKTPYMLSPAYYMNDFSSVIQIRRKFYATPIQVSLQWSLWNYAHGTTAVLSWYVQNFVALWYHTIEMQ